MADVLGGLIEQLADTIAERVLAKVDVYLASRSESVPQAAYRVEEAAQALGLSVSEVRRRVAAGELASRRVGRVPLIPRSAIEQFLSAPSTNGTTH
ncbi:MAG TPA: helix-turn-helix domain-containing protein [Chloroflexota bacterium]